MHVLGKTGSGKSYFLAGLFLAMHEAGMPVTLIDPHGDLAELVLTHLVQRGEFAHRAAYDRLIYLDLPAGKLPALHKVGQNKLGQIAVRINQGDRHPGLIHCQKQTG